MVYSQFLHHLLNYALALTSYMYQTAKRSRSYFSIYYLDSFCYQVIFQQKQKRLLLIDLFLSVQFMNLCYFLAFFDCIPAVTSQRDTSVVACPQNSTSTSASKSLPIHAKKVRCSCLKTHCLKLQLSLHVFIVVTVTA